uniref:Cactin_mid domain-containing protein n=1 Tax=Macrostomum lignano TaxID=282301 RepID=A0A1I8JH95_9PLAT
MADVERKAAENRAELEKVRERCRQNELEREARLKEQEQEQRDRESEKLSPVVAAGGRVPLEAGAGQIGHPHSRRPRQAIDLLGRISGIKIKRDDGADDNDDEFDEDESLAFLDAIRRTALLTGLSGQVGPAQLAALEDSVSARICAAGPGTDLAYWEEMVDKVKVAKAKATLQEQRQSADQGAEVDDPEVAAASATGSDGNQQRRLRRKAGGRHRRVSPMTTRPSSRGKQQQKQQQQQCSRLLMRTILWSIFAGKTRSGHGRRSDSDQLERRVGQAGASPAVRLATRQRPRPEEKTEESLRVKTPGLGGLVRPAEAKEAAGYKFNIFLPGSAGQTSKAAQLDSTEPCKDDPQICHPAASLLGRLYGKTWLFKIVRNEWDTSFRHGFRCPVCC